MVRTRKSRIVFQRRPLGDHFERLLLAGQEFFRPPAFGHVPCEAAGVDELAVPEQHAGVDQHVLDRPVLAPQAGRVLVQLLPGLQAARMSQITSSSAWKSAMGRPTYSSRL